MRRGEDDLEARRDSPVFPPPENQGRGKALPSGTAFAGPTDAAATPGGGEGDAMGQGQLGADPAAIESLMASGAILSMILVIALGTLFLLLGVVVPWFVWRTKVYTKRTYLLMRDWARWEQARTGPGGRADTW